MNLLLAIFIGGGAGALMRHLSVLAANALFGDRFPYGTLFVNVAGSLAIGIVMEAVARKANISPPVQALLVTGFLGGFTTFSAFSLDAWKLWQAGQTGGALAYIAASVGLSLIAVALGATLTERVLA